MKRLTIVGVAVLFLFSASASIALTGPEALTEMCVNRLADLSLAKHANYFRSQYGSMTKGVPFYACEAIVAGEKLATQYESVLKSLKKEKDKKSIIPALKTFEEALVSELTNYSEVWRKAIDDQVRYGELSTVDFSTALSITRIEYSRIGVFSKISAIEEELKRKISKLDKQKYQRTYELYAIVSQLITLSKEPRGSLMTFNSTVDSLETDFSKALALAELEF